MQTVDDDVTTMAAALHSATLIITPSDLIVLSKGAVAVVVAVVIIITWCCLSSRGSATSPKVPFSVQCVRSGPFALDRDVKLHPDRTPPPLPPPLSHTKIRGRFRPPCYDWVWDVVQSRLFSKNKKINHTVQIKITMIQRATAHRAENE